jgi:light-regulated signal transduction histidine kinase (bacteriophytochrome)
MIAGEIETYSMPKRYIHKNGSIVWIQLSVSSKKKDGKVDFFISQIEDITDRKRIETEIRVRNYELENIKLELENFAHVVSHDLKAPLRAIHNLTQWLEEDLQNLDASAIEKMHLIQDRSQRMSDLIDGILEYSRVGRSNVENSIISVSACIEDAIKLLQPHEFEITYDEMPTITMNKTRLIQVFSNLLNNAISHHHNPEHGKCHISCTEDEEFYTFYVKDNGPGIDEKYHHKIFEMFTTLHTKDSNKGVGAGLAQTKKIVEHRGGKIWVESVDKSGSTFIFTIPKEVIVHESI